MIFLLKMHGISEMHLSVQTIRTCKKVSTKQQNIWKRFSEILLLNEKNELHNRNLHISGILNEEKVDINLVQADIIEPVSGYGKGKYKFKK